MLLPFLFLGRVPLLKKTTKKGYPYYSILLEDLVKKDLSGLDPTSNLLICARSLLGGNEWFFTVAVPTLEQLLSV